MTIHRAQDVGRASTLPVLILLHVLPLATAVAQDTHIHGQEPEHHSGLHFSHPLITESVSPDTKIRANTGRVWEGDATETELEFEAEYAFHRSFSIEFGAPFSVVDPEGGSSVSGLANLEVLFKFANDAFEEHGLLLGYGVEFGVPTGDDASGIGSDHIWEIEPLFNVGYKRGPIELVGFARFGIPFNQDAGDEIETDVAYDVSALAHLHRQVQGLLEFNGVTVLSGEEAGETATLLSPGLKFAPSARVPLFIGLGVRLPLSDAELDTALLASLFYHF